MCISLGCSQLACAAERLTGEHARFQSDFGGVGLMQTPTARMAPLGRMAVQYSRVNPYERYSFFFQPFNWFEVGFRYTEVRNRILAPELGQDLFIDKGLDVKFRLLEESRLLPAVSLGLRDIGGTGLFGAEYLVATKRWHDLEFSLGVGTGQLAQADEFENPLGVFSDRFDDRVGRGGDNGGDFNANQFFTGPVGFFGGIQYRTPVDGLYVQLEYEGNDYQNEALNNNLDQDSRINAGLRYRVNNALTLSAGWERGNTAMIGVTLGLGLADLSQPKSDPPKVPVGPAPEKSTRNWEGVSDGLKNNAGIDVDRIARNEHSLVVEGEPTTYREIPEAEQRANRILHNATSSEVTEFRYRWKEQGITLREDVLPRDPLPKVPYINRGENGGLAEGDYRLDVYAQGVPKSRVDDTDGKTLYEPDDQSFYFGVSPGFNQTFGGLNGYLYQIYGRLSFDYRMDENGWLSGVGAIPLVGNYDGKEFIAPSQLPRVRTSVVEYLQDTDAGIYNLQYTRTGRLSDNWFGMAYAGMLELMYAGVGGEVLYRPFDSPVAFGFDLNYVRQRDFDQRLGLRDYSTLTGHATAYIETGIKNILAKVSAGRYLAKDEGVTFDFSRQFESGVRLGAFATFTTADDKFGEGSFDKGIYVSIPLGALLGQSSRQYSQVLWRPLTRDGGAKLSRRYRLYNLTRERDLDSYWRDYE